MSLELVQNEKIVVILDDRNIVIYKGYKDMEDWEDELLGFLIDSLHYSRSLGKDDVVEDFLKILRQFNYC